MKNILSLLFIFILLVNCGGRRRVKPIVQPIKKGEIVNVRCQKAPEEGYFVYQPIGRQESKAPLIIFLDSHGKGSVPVQAYKSLSDKYGCVIAGSNNIQNGISMDEAVEHYFNILFDLKNRIVFDSFHVYLAGFSGGARMACIIAVTQQNISGVIACSAGIDRSLLQTRPSFSYVGITGISDMNYSELTTTDKQLEQTGAFHQLLIFDGKHEWPPLSTMDEAFLYTFLTAMKKEPDLRNDTLIAQAKELFIQKKSSDAKGNLHYLKVLQQEINYLNGLQDVTALKDEASKLSALPGVKMEIERELEIESKENEYKQKIINAFSDKDINWWKKEVASLQSKITTSPADEAAMFNRVLGFASLASFSNVNYALKNRNIEMVSHFLQIYSMVDPQNPDCAYFYACYYMLKQDSQNAIKSLNEAIDKGFNDIEKLNQDPFFISIQNETGFLSAKKRIQK